MSLLRSHLHSSSGVMSQRFRDKSCRLLAETRTARSPQRMHFFRGVSAAFSVPPIRTRPPPRRIPYTCADAETFGAFLTTLR